MADNERDRRKHEGMGFGPMDLAAVLRLNAKGMRAVYGKDAYMGELLSDAADSIDSLTQQLDRVRKDSERLDWLDGRRETFDAFGGSPREYAWGFIRPEDSLRAAIDAAISISSPADSKEE